VLAHGQRVCSQGHPTIPHDSKNILGIPFITITIIIIIIIVIIIK
jgi:hypothetical protein